MAPITVIEASIARVYISSFLDIPVLVLAADFLSVPSKFFLQASLRKIFSLLLRCLQSGSAVFPSPSINLR